MILFALVAATLSTTPNQLPDSFTNLKVLPKNITRDSLIQIMRGFSLSLNVRCQYCHVGGDGMSFVGVEFAKDEDLDKRSSPAWRSTLPARASAMAASCR